MNRRPIVCTVLAAAVLFGCTNNSSGAQTVPSASSVTTVPDPTSSAGGSVDASDASSNVPVGDATATPWSIALADIGADGRYSKEAALTLFALAFDGMPGIDTPPGPRNDIRSGTMALRWVLAYQSELTPAQQARVAEVRAIPDEAGAEPMTVDPLGFAPSLTTLPPPKPPDEAGRHLLEAIGKQIRQDISARLGGDIPGVIRIVYDPRNNPDGDVGMADPSFTSDVYSGCTIHMFPNAFLADRVPAVTIAHEMIHCFQFAAYSTTHAMDWAPRWIIEGSAEWAGATLTEPDALELQLWPLYLTRPETDLRKRDYDAIGFYAHLDETGHSPWAVFRKMWVAGGTSEDAFVASGATDPVFLDTWAASTTRQPSLGSQWDTTGPGITADQPTPRLLSIGKQPVDVTAHPYALALYDLDISTDLVRFSLTGNGMLADGTLDTAISSGGVYCTNPDGCVCPGSSGADTTAIPGLEPSGALLALTGGQAGTSGTVQGLGLDEFCTASGDAWSFAVFQGDAVAPALAGYTCDGLASTWHVIFGPGSPAFERTYDLAFSPSMMTVHSDLVYDFPPDAQSPPLHVEWRLDYTLDTTADPPAIRVSGTQHETPEGGSEVVFDTNFGTGDGITLENVTLPVLLADRGYAHPFLDQARAACG